MSVIEIEAITAALPGSTALSGVDLQSQSSAALFQQMMNDPNMIVHSADEPMFSPLAGQVANTFNVHSTQGIGGQMLDGLQGVRQNIDGHFSTLHTAVTEADPNSIVDLLSLQYDVVRFSFELDMTSKVAGQMSSHADRFLTQQ